MAKYEIIHAYDSAELYDTNCSVSVNRPALYVDNPELINCKRCIARIVAKGGNAPAMDLHAIIKLLKERNG